MRKRLFDIALAGALLPVAAPLVALTALAVWIESGRPVVFCQVRSGRGGQPFRLYKIRTLALGDGSYRSHRERATRIGAVLRRWGLDELPQLWNVLRGEMSLVGPRPTLPEQVTRYGAFERQRLAVRPGLTGWAQVRGRNALSWPERIRLDVWYVHNRNLWLDFRILLQTPFILATQRGVYGPGGGNFDFS